jgi:hypothetical protein
MIWSSEEYSKGFIDFDGKLPVGCSINIWTDTTDNPNEKIEHWTGPYSISSGCKVLSLPKQYIVYKYFEAVPKSIFQAETE